MTELVIRQMEKIGAYHKAAVAVVASSHELQNGKNDTPKGMVLVDKKAVLALNSVITSKG